MTADDWTEAKTALADTVERFARTEIAPHINQWEAAGEFPRALYARAAQLGLLGIGYPQSLGGADDAPTPIAVKLGMWINLARFGGSGGVFASLFSHNIGMPPLLAYG
jgi:acyl-CoA dehydrogenase